MIVPTSSELLKQTIILSSSISLTLGPGEQGSAVILSADEESKKDTLYKVNGFNALASDKISLDRALKDIRHPE